ncbi:MAG: bifunctional nuclease family protein [Caldilineae bacterium]|nr:bifunctional nuclease family protein [Anaerolineae bacterium]MCB0199547.1 bifunctional nuclease family protein [Anaerolineae bacterium]MCB0204142.1 bifunctional nuclease family protein [Anaerolineae bacterium]MCB0255482.1 bifunctional nuclease family protein [Anaerolineae bacterium]MCB9154480.1 bifunctional nuclease family protein [Caldilineae bacterium]
MVEVTIDSVRVSLMSQHRVVVLREIDGERFLPIWIGPFEADAITIELQGVEVARPLTHDLLKSMITLLGAEVQQVIINDLNNDTFYARIVLDVDGDDIEVDSRPSDAIALAVRCSVPVVVADHVMDKASIMPEDDAREDSDRGPTDEEDLDVFRDFVEGLDLGGLGGDA